jgi:hypothetical protein
MGRAGSISKCCSSAGGAVEDPASGAVAATRPRGGSAGGGAMNRGDWVASASLSCGSGGSRISSGAALSTGAGRSVNRPRPLFDGGGAEGRCGSDCRAGEPFRERSTGEVGGAGGGPDGSRRAGAGEKDLSVTPSRRGGGMRRLGSSAGSRSQPEEVRAGGDATATRGDSEASRSGGRGWLSRHWVAELPP